MKTPLRSLALVGGCCLGLLVLPQSGRSQGFYLNANAGVSLAEDVKISQFITPTPGAKFKLEAGPQFGVAGGYNFNDYVGAQLESGFIFNTVENSGSADAALSHVPMLVDVVLRYDKPDCKWVPYLGAGAGGDVSIITLDYVTAPGGAVVDGSGSAVVFAWQAFAGLRYRINPAMSVGAGYKYFSANGATWDVEHTAGDIKSGSAQVHSFGVDFSWKF